MENETEITKDSDGWKEFLQKRWGMLAYWVVVGVIAVVGAVLVFLWFVDEAQLTSLVPAGLGQWSMENLVMFILHLLFWELVIVGIPVAVAAIVAWWWWTKIPEDERKRYTFFNKGSKAQNGGSGVSLLFFIAFCIKVYVDGNWGVPIATWTLDYVIDSMITIMVWCVIVFGIPAAIIGILWLIHEKGKKN
jgi:hypothetical protein